MFFFYGFCSRYQSSVKPQALVGHARLGQLTLSSSNSWNLCKTDSPKITYFLLLRWPEGVVVALTGLAVCRRCAASEVLLNFVIFNSRILPVRREYSFVSWLLRRQLCYQTKLPISRARKGLPLALVVVVGTHPALASSSIDAARLRFTGLNGIWLSLFHLSMELSVFSDRRGRSRLLVDTTPQDLIPNSF
ncbi:hypothetical protein Q3G72_009561 [Acer saccharum]|nr:hypothetical protein Q3G72_009561 [Acer saccharum]